MVNEKLLGYVISEIKKGTDTSVISKVLVEKGWKQFDVDEAINQAEAQTASGKDSLPSPDEPEAPQVIVDDKVKPKKPLAKILALMLFVLLLVGGGLYGYFEVYLAPERVFARSAQKMETVKSFAYNGTFGLRVKGDLFGGSSSAAGISELLQLSVLNYSLDLDGAIDALENESSPKSKVLATFKTNDVSIAKFETLSTDNKDLFFYIHDIAVLASLGLDNTDILTGKWIRINLDEVSKQLGVDPATYESQVEEVKTNQDEIRQIILQNDPLVLGERLKSEEVDSVNTYHYAFSVDKEKLADAASEIAGKLTAAELTDDEKEDNRKKFDNMQFFGGEMWIGKSDLYLRRIKLSVKIEDEDNPDVSMTLGADLAFKNFNKDQGIQKPADYVEATDVYNDYVNSMSFPAMPSDVEFYEASPSGFETTPITLPQESTGSGLQFITDKLDSLFEKGVVAGVHTGE